MIRHIGYGLVDKDGDFVTDDSDGLEFEEDYDIAKRMKDWYEKNESREAPYKIVRVLIDDEVIND